jgi:Fe-S-cluster containining protein
MTTLIDRVAGALARNPGPAPTLLLAECATCPGHCCRNDTILLHPEQGDVAALYVTEPTVHPMTGKPARMLAHKPNGDCVYLADVGGVGRCSAYAFRPVICRAFDCGRSYARLTRTERRQMVRAGAASAEVFEQGRKVQEARARRNAQEAP